MREEITVSYIDNLGSTLKSQKNLKKNYASYRKI